MGYSQKNCLGVCSPLSKTLALFISRIFDFPYPIYDLAKISYSVYGRCSCHSCSKHNLWRALVDVPIDFNNDEKVASKKKTGHYFLPKWPKSISIRLKNIPFGATHTDIVHIGEYPPPLPGP